MMENYNPGYKRVALARRWSCARTDFIEESYKTKKKAKNAEESKLISGTEQNSEGIYNLDVFRGFRTCFCI
jgi:hypothetical protein